MRVAGFALLLCAWGLAGCSGGSVDVPWDGNAIKTPTPTPTGPGQLFFADFEADDGGMTVVDNGGQGAPSWEWCAPTSGPGRAVSGTNVWATDCSGRYRDYEDNCLETPPIDLPAGQPQDLHYDLAVETESGYDYWRVTVSDGTNSTFLDGGDGGNASNYDHFVFGLDTLAGSTITVSFCLETDDGVIDWGLYVDNVEVRAQ